MFTFYFKQSGAARKPFVKAVSEILEAKPKYLGMPSAAYEIDVVYVTKEGNIELNERTDSELVENLIDRLAERGYEAEPVEGTEKEAFTEEEPMEPARETEFTEPVEETAPAKHDEEVEPTESAGEREPGESEQPCEEEADVEGESPEDFSVTISVARSVMTDSGIENLKKLVWAKGELLKQAFDIESTEIVVSEQGISFPWFGRLEPDEVKLTSEFISSLCKFANASKRVTSKPRREGNPKFAMRVWMLRMGFSGAEYKDLRRYMLRRLPGDAAFRYGRPDAQETPAEDLNEEVPADGE